MFPAVSVNQTASVHVNLGREPFCMPLPEGYLAVEDPERSASSWLARFEHAGDVTETVFARRQLPDAVVDLTFSGEDASADAKPITVTPHSKNGCFARTDPSRLVAGNSYHLCNPDLV